MRRRAVLFLAVAGVLLLTAFGLWELSKARGYQVFGELVDRVETSAPVVALTFDDGPTPAYTEEVLAILREQGVVATFFLTGHEIEANPEAARAIIEAGHEIGNHSYDHPRMILMGWNAVRDQVERTDAAIRAAGYEEPIHFRPPYGRKLAVLPLYLSRTGRTSVTWDVEPESDAALATDPDAMTAHVLERARPGSIILLHVMYGSRETSRRALPGIIEGLRARGFDFATVSDLMALEAQAGA